jgi:hypothetical protein
MDLIDNGLFVSMVKRSTNLKIGLNDFLAAICLLMANVGVSGSQAYKKKPSINDVWLAIMRTRSPACL